MNSVLVFTGRSGIDSEDFRWQLLRVPEVSKILKEAQAVIDAQAPEARDLVSFMFLENRDYLASGLWRDLAAQLIQVGLFRRYQKYYPQPRFLIGDAGEHSAAQVCLGKITLGDLVGAFCATLAEKNEQEKSNDFLVGQSLELAKVFEQGDDGYRVVAEGKRALELLDGIVKDHLVDQVITLGSATALGVSDSISELGVVESVIMDPLLSWLWPYLQIA